MWGVVFAWEGRRGTKGSGLEYVGCVFQLICLGMEKGHQGLQLLAVLTQRRGK